MVDQEKHTTITFYTRTIGTDGVIRSVGRTEEEAEAALVTAAAEVDDVDLAAAYTVRVSVDRSHGRVAVYSMFEPSHGPLAAEMAWQAIQ